MDLLYTVSRGIVFITLIKHLKLTHPDVMNPWQAADSGALGMFNHLENYFKALKCNGLERGYYPDPTKSILVVHPQNPESGEEFMQRHCFRVCTSACCIWGYIGYEKTKGDWLKERTKKREREICALRKRPISILRRGMPWWTVWFNRIGSFINV